jgi:hypothetical protein
MGFFITPETISSNYESVGLFCYEIVPSAEYDKFTVIDSYSYDLEPRTIRKYKWVIENVSLNQAMDSVYTNCVTWGADAIIDFKIESISNPYLTKEPVTINGFKISGFAIKRK